MAKRQRRKRQERRQEHAKRQGWQTRHSVITGVGLAAGAALGMTSVAQANYLYVGSNADTTGAADCTNSGNTDCTLRQAITDANAGSTFDYIYFQSGITGTITLGSQLSITNPVGIYGPGPDVLTVSGNHASRVFDVDPATPGDFVGITGLKIANGQVSGPGGGVRDEDAKLILFDTVVTGNTASTRGGGLYERGIFNDGQDLYVGHSTFSGNTAEFGGGIYGPFYLGDNGPAAGVHNSTFSGNHATDGMGGALFTDESAYVTDSTISGNTATDSGGGVSAANGVGFYNSIASGNSAPIGRDSDTYLFAGSSLIQSSSEPIYSIPGYANIIGQSAQLGSLANNGGPTPTMRPLATSPVIDQGYASEDSDQRFFDRQVDVPGVPNAPVGYASDMGAVELTLAEAKKATTPGLTPTPTPTPTPIQPKQKCKKKKHHKRSAESAKKKKCKKKKKRSAAHTSAFGGPGQHWPDGVGQHPFRLGR
jgi:hypothetical protein